MCKQITQLWQNTINNMTVSCCVLGHLAHSAAESDVCSLSDAWCLCFACCFDSHSCFNKGLLYCRCVQCSLIYARGLNSSSQSQLRSLLQGLFPARSSFHSLGREMNPTSDIPEGEGYTHYCNGRQVEIPPQGRGRSVCLENLLATLSIRLSFWHSWPGLARSLAPLLNHMCHLRDWWSVPVSTLPTRAFLLTLVGDGKSCESKGWTHHVRRCCTASEMISSCLTSLNQMQMNSRGFWSFSKNKWLQLLSCLLCKAILAGYPAYG